VETNALLYSIGLHVGIWNQITAKNFQNEKKEERYICIKSPRDAWDLYVFSQHISEWLPKGNWNILRFDNSTSLDAMQKVILSKYIKDFDFVKDNYKNYSFKLEFEETSNHIMWEVEMSCIIFYILLFQAHAQIVSSSCERGQYLSIQDGFIYFMYENKKVKILTNNIVKRMEKNTSPSWVINLIDKSN
jgi:hypothetical protein